jgi:hypothetical protein
VRFRFLDISPDDRRVYFQQAAARRNMSPVLIEKDFWVCWVLSVLFESRFAEALVFKGGTSLSKVFRVIERFSEDIDLSLSPEICRIPQPETEEVSKSRAKKWMDEAQRACAALVRDEMQPELERTFKEVLGEPEDAWTTFEVDGATKSPVILFHYPSSQAAALPYIPRLVKLEFGSLTDQRPVGRHAVRPWLAEEIPSIFEDWYCEVVTLELERTFWEKATILHLEHYRPDDNPAPDRYSRHYGDMAALAEHPSSREAAERDDLRERVVIWKSKFFPRGWARYDLARPGTFKLVPPTGRMPALRRDYRAMRDMYFTEPVPFEGVMETLEALERKINGNVGG